MNADAGKRILPLLAATLLIAHAPSATATGVNLFWNDCSVGATAMSNRSFACNTNASTNVLTASFDPPDGITKLVGVSAVIDIQTTSTPLPSWWQMSAGGCRAGALRLDLIAPPSQSCADYWLGAATGSIAYLPGFGGHPDHARITISFGIPEAMAGPVAAGTEYYAFRLIMDSSKTVGSEACSGCADPTCLVLSSLWLYQTPGLGDYGICNPAYSSMANWQGAFFCPPVDSPPPWWPQDCMTTPTNRRSWGLIKGLYR